MAAKFQVNSRDGSILLIVSAVVLQLAFFAPMQVLIQNFGEFSVRFLDVFLLLLAISAVMIVFLYLLVRALESPILPAILMFVSVVVFLESRIFLSLARHQPFDGKLIAWSALQGLSYVELGVIAILGIVFVIFYRQTRLWSVVSLFILVFVTGGFLFTVYWHTDVILDERQVESTESIYFDQFYRLSSQRNVIHIVPDQAQGAMLHDILASDFERYSKVFDGFTLFTQAVGQYEGTYPSVLYYMTGEAPEPETDLTLSQPFGWDYIAETLQERSIVRLLSDNGFNTFGFQFHPGIFCKGPYTACIGTHDEVFGGVAVNSPERRFMLTIMTVLDVSLFQSVPIALRQKIYDDGRWLIRKLDRKTATHSGILDYFSDQMLVLEGPPSYNYFHHAGAHAPLLFDKDCNYAGLQEINRENQQGQVNCTLAQLEKMIRALKNNGAYDQTMIVINGDHGSPWLPPSYPVRSGSVESEALIGMASTFMLIKPPETRGAMKYSDKAVTTGDIPASIAGVLEIDHNYRGVHMFKDQPGFDRKRLYFSYESAAKAHRLQALRNMTRYRILGDVFDENDWVLPNTMVTGNSASQMKMDHPEFSLHTEGFSFLEQHSGPRRWVDGNQARVFLEPPREGSVALVFESYVPSSIEGQWIEISVGGRLIKRLDAKELQAKRHIVPVPDDIPRTGRLDIEFKIGKTVQAGEDLRQLSVLFAYIGLVPVS